MRATNPVPPREVHPAQRALLSTIAALGLGVVLLASPAWAEPPEPDATIPTHELEKKPESGVVASQAMSAAVSERQIEFGDTVTVAGVHGMMGNVSLVSATVNTPSRQTIGCRLTLRRPSRWASWQTRPST